MPLLQKLGLTPTVDVAKALAARAAASEAAEAAARPPEAKPGQSAAGTAAKGGAGKSGSGKSASDESASEKGTSGMGAKPGNADAQTAHDAAKLKTELERRYRESHAAMSKLEEAGPKVDQLIAAAKGPEKAVLEGKKKALEKKLAEAKREVDELQKDAEVLDNVALARDDYARILARHKATATLVGLSEIDLHEGDLARKKGEKHETRTTSSYENGKASVETTDTRRSWGLDGGTVSRKHETETAFEGNTVKTSQESKTNVSLDGKLSNETAKSVEIETADGKTMKVEKGTSTEVSAEGASRTVKDKQEHRDGSSSETSRTGGVERGEGKLGASLGKTTTQTDAGGNSSSTGKSGKAGMVAGKDGYGGFAEGEGSLRNQHANGLATGAVAGLHANVVCNIGDPVGKPPQPVKYPLTLEVNLGASIALSTGYDKKEGAAKAGIEAKAGKTIFMKRTYLLSETQAASYVASLASASKGTLAGTRREFGIIAAGAKKGWPFAQAMFLGVDSKDLAVGESSERGGATTKSGKASVDAKAIQLEASVEKNEQHSAKTTRQEDGTLQAELDASSTDKVSGKVGIKSGVVGGSAGRSHALTTSSGYVIKVDPTRDPKGERQKALDACDSQKDYDAFAAKYPDCVESATRGSDESDSETVGLAIGAVDAEIGLHSGVKQKTKTGKGGKLESREVTGSAGGGGSVGIGKTRVGDSVDNEATAKLDGDGNASLDLSKTRKSTDWTKLAKSKLPFLGDKKKDGDEGSDKPAQGILSKAAGGGEEVDTEDMEKVGLSLSNKDLDAIGRIATGNQRRWEKGAIMDYMNSHEAWETARKKIVAAGGHRQVVADELARFVGGSKSNRLDMVQRFLRPDGDVSIGKLAAFPDSMKQYKADFDRLVLGDSELAIAQAAARDGPARAAALGQETFDALEKLNAAITGAKQSIAPAIRAEMLSALNARKTKVLEAMRANAGKQSADDEKKALENDFRRMTKTCLQHEFAQNDIFEQFGELWAPGRSYNNIKLVKLLQQARDLYAVWKPDYARCEELGKKIGYPESNYGHYRPADDRLADWEKKIHQY